MHVASSNDPLPKYFNCGLVVEIGPMLWGLGFHMAIKKEIFENFLGPHHKVYSFHIWRVASSDDPLRNTSNYGSVVEIGPMLWCYEPGVTRK